LEAENKQYEAFKADVHQSAQDDQMTGMNAKALPNQQEEVASGLEPKFRQSLLDFQPLNTVLLKLFLIPLFEVKMRL
jgi:hypothetical protein